MHKDRNRMGANRNRMGASRKRVGANRNIPERGGVKRGGKKTSSVTLEKGL